MAADIRATLDAEFSVIGALLVKPDICGELLTLAAAEDFTVPELQAVFRAAAKLFTSGRDVDAVTIRNLVGAEYNDLLMRCMDVMPSAGGWRTYVSAMQEQTRVQRLREFGIELQNVRTTAEGRDLLTAANETLTEQHRAKAVTMQDALMQFYTAQSEKRQFIRWGLDKLDGRLYSAHGDFVILAGRPSAGKTALALQMAAYMGDTEAVGFYSLETSPEKLMNRLIANRCIVDFGAINRRELTEDEMMRVTKTGKSMLLANKLEFFQSSGWSVDEIAAMTLARRQKIIFVDYLQLIRAKGRDRFEQVTNISLALHTFAQRCGVLVVALSQLSRQSAKNDAPTMTDLRESGQIEQDADAILALYEPEDEEIPDMRRLRVLKNKEGRLGEFPLFFDGGTQSFAQPMDGEIGVRRNVKRMERYYHAE